MYATVSTTKYTSSYTIVFIKHNILDNTSVLNDDLGKVQECTIIQVTLNYNNLQFTCT